MSKAPDCSSQLCMKMGTASPAATAETQAWKPADRCIKQSEAATQLQALPTNRSCCVSTSE